MVSEKVLDFFLCGCVPSFIDVNYVQIYRCKLCKNFLNDFRLNLVKKNDVTLPYHNIPYQTIPKFYGIFSFLLYLFIFGISNREKLRVLNFIQIYIFLIFWSAILDP